MLKRHTCSPSLVRSAPTVRSRLSACGTNVDQIAVNQRRHADEKAFLRIGDLFRPKLMVPTPLQISGGLPAPIFLGRLPNAARLLLHQCAAKVSGACDWTTCGCVAR